MSKLQATSLILFYKVLLMFSPLVHSQKSLPTPGISGVIVNL